MQKRLYFICPTDFLETVINDSFKGENYFITSLGNSIALDTDKIDGINTLIETIGIQEITFILSMENRIALSALKDREFSGLHGLECFHDDIERQMAYTKIQWKTNNLGDPILYYLLNEKVSELKSKLSNWEVDQIKIGAKIYNRKMNFFTEITPDLINKEYISLN